MADRLMQRRSAPAGRREAVRAAVVAGLVALAGCTATPPDGAINDPYEPANRRVHAFNKGLDRVAVRPASQVYGHVLPAPVREGVGNVAGNLGLPSAVLNSVLQGRAEAAGKNGFRFVINTTLGVGGVFDPASSFGLTEEKTDFGETLHVWGAREGAYVELPVFGPSTERDAAGILVDLVTDPLNFVIERPESNYSIGTRVAANVGDRYRFTNTVDSVLYDSADSYAQSRLLYLQNRRFDLGTTSEADAYDPYEDPYADQ